MVYSSESISEAYIDTQGYNTLFSVPSTRDYSTEGFLSVRKDF